jgi:hypothetical protein
VSVCGTFRLVVAAAALLPATVSARGLPAPEAVRRELERVYARPEFRRRGGNLWAEFLDALGRFFSWLGGLHGESPALFWLVLTGCVTLLVLLTGHIAWTVFRAVYVGRRGGADSPAEQRRRLSAGFRADAEARAAAGDFTEAVRLLFLSLVYAFDEAGRVPFRPALTNREYLGFFEDRPAVAQSLRVFVDLLDANWYGLRPTGGDEYGRCLALYDGVRNQG